MKRLKAAALLEKRRRANSRHSGLDLLTWAVVHRRQLGPEKPFDLRLHPFLVEIYQAQAKRLVVYKASQMGASEYLVSYSLHAADQRQATVLYIFPTDTHVSDFSSARFGPAIEASDYLDGIVLAGNAAGGQRGADRVTLKRVRDRFLYFRGGKVTTYGQAPQLKSIDADVVIFDEWDEMDPRAPAIGRKRLGHSMIGEERAVSTPTYPGRGIHAEWMESDQRLWHVRCEGCGERQPLTIDSIVREWDSLGRPVGWNGGPLPGPPRSGEGANASPPLATEGRIEGGAWCACRRCGKRLDHLGPGEWVATWPGREVAGFHLTKLFSHQADLLAIVQGLQTTDETKRREAFNQDLGEPYTPKGGQLTDELLDACRREYGPGPAPGRPAWMGVDVGKVLNVVIRGEREGDRGERRQLLAAEVESFEEVGRLMKRFNVRTTVIDALPETRQARAFQAEFGPGRVWLAYYVNQVTGTKHASPAVWNEEQGVVNLDRTRTLDQMLAEIYAETHTLPANAQGVENYYTQMKAPVRILETRANGEKVPKYVESGADHYAHAENYCRVAMDAPMNETASSSRTFGVNELFG